MRLPDFDDVARARERIAGRVMRTPTLRSAALDARTFGAILVKAEPLQRTGSFKLRGATNAILALPEAERRRGIVTYSSGNHGQAIACAASAAGTSAVVVMPEDAPRIKRESTEAWGAEIVLYDRAGEDREAIGQRIAAERGATIIPPFDHPDVIAGQGTLALELAEDARDAGLALDAVLVCCGGGGLVAGCALALEGVAPAARVHPVEPEGFDDTANSLAAGARVPHEAGATSICDSLLSPMPGVLTFAINQPRLAPGLTVTDAQALAAMAFAFRHLKLVVEPGGAVALAALLAGGFDARGKVVGIVLSGGNVDPALFARALAVAAR